MSTYYFIHQTPSVVRAVTWFDHATSTDVEAVPAIIAHTWYHSGASGTSLSCRTFDNNFSSVLHRFCQKCLYVNDSQIISKVNSWYLSLLTEFHPLSQTLVIPSVLLCTQCCTAEKRTELLLFIFLLICMHFILEIIQTLSLCKKTVLKVTVNNLSYWLKADWKLWKK